MGRCDGGTVVVVDNRNLLVLAGRMSHPGRGGNGGRCRTARTGRGELGKILEHFLDRHGLQMTGRKHELVRHDKSRVRGLLL